VRGRHSRRIGGRRYRVPLQSQCSSTLPEWLAILRATDIGVVAIAIRVIGQWINLSHGLILGNGEVNIVKKLDFGTAERRMTGVW
jgi:hypothetical protein